MPSRTHALGAFLALSLCYGAAQAEVRQFYYTGVVTSAASNPLSDVKAGSLITGSFSYDTSTVGRSFPSSPVTTYDNLPNAMTATVGSHQFSSSKMDVAVINDFHGNMEDGLEISGGYPLQFDGQTLPDGSVGIALSSQPDNTGVLTSGALPAVIDLDAYDAGSTLNYGWVQRDGSQGGGIITFNLLNITSVPEPAAGALWLMGLAGVSVGLRRRAVARR